MPEHTRLSHPSLYAFMGGGVAGGVSLFKISSAHLENPYPSLESLLLPSRSVPLHVPLFCPRVLSRHHIYLRVGTPWAMSSLRTGLCPFHGCFPEPGSELQRRPKEGKEEGREGGREERTAGSAPSGELGVQPRGASLSCSHVQLAISLQPELGSAPPSSLSPAERP